MKKITLGILTVSLGLLLSGCSKGYNSYAIHSVKYYEKQIKEHPNKTVKFMNLCNEENKKAENMNYKELKALRHSNLAMDCGRVLNAAAIVDPSILAPYQ